MFSTKNVSANRVSPVIGPGNHKVKINSLSFDATPYDPQAFNIILNVETEPISGFEGFWVDKDDESKGHYAGQIGRVKASQYAFADGETKSGIKIQRDRSILIFLRTLAHTMGLDSWFLEQDGQHETIEDFVKAFNKTADFRGKFLEFCVAGKEYEGKTGYTNYDMWLPKAEGKKYAFGAIEAGAVISFDEAKHLKKLEVKEVKSFGDDDDVFHKPKTSSDFSLD